ncbi:MAG: N-formylmaleamate deformylase [Candidatus Azotimanducaceae bacterium]|jgi:N-formylmaleamate deformylase
MKAWREGNVGVGEVQTHFYRTGHGDKPGLVLAHGFSDNGLCWSRVASALQEDFDIVMVDARNHGQSSRASLTPSDLVDDLAAVISGLGLDRPNVLGHSMGGSTVAGLAAGYPNLVSKIILEDPPWMTSKVETVPEDVERRQAGFRKYIKSFASMSDEQILTMGKKQHPAWHDDDFPAWVTSNRQVGELAMQGLQKTHWIKVVGHIQCPALLIYADGDTDGLIKQPVVDQVLETNKFFKSVHIADAGHNIRREQFKLYMQAVKTFLLSG